MATYLMVSKDCFVGTRLYGALLQVAEDDDASGGWICRDVYGEDVFANSEPKPFNREDIDGDDIVFARVQDVETFDTWQEAQAAAMEAIATYE